MVRSQSQYNTTLSLIIWTQHMEGNAVNHGKLRNLLGTVRQMYCRQTHT